MKIILGFLLAVNAVLLVIVGSDYFRPRISPTGPADAPKLRGSHEILPDSPTGSERVEMSVVGSGDPVGIDPATERAVAEHRYSRQGTGKSVAEVPSFRSPHPFVPGNGFEHETVEPVVRDSSISDPVPFIAPLAQASPSPPFARLPIVLLNEGNSSGHFQIESPIVKGDSVAAGEEIKERLEDQFVAGIGGPDQDPNDPEYARRWHEALLESNRNFRAFYGKQAYLEKDISSSREAGRN